MKVTIDEICDFINKGWPGEDWYMDDCYVGHDEEAGAYKWTNKGCIPREPGLRVNLADFEAAVLWQGKGEDPTGGDGYSFLTLFRKWKKAQTTTVLVVEVPNDRAEELRAFVGKLKGKVK